MTAGPLLPKELVAEVRRRTDLVVVAGRYVALRRDGAAYSGPCPFHAAGPPGVIHVSPARQTFRCPACGVSGDVFGFVGRVTGQPFPLVVRLLAREAGVTLPERPLTPAQRQRRDERRELERPLEIAVSVWEANLAGEGGSAAREVLRRLGVADRVARDFRVGYATPGWRDLRSAAEARGGSLALFQRAGLLSAGDLVAAHDRFRARLTFPVLENGRAVGVLTQRPGEGRSGDGPALLASPESAMFARGRAFIGADQAAVAIATGRTAVLAPDPILALLAHGAGHPEVLATGGPVCDGHVAQLRRRGVERVVLVETPLLDGGGSFAVASASALLAGGLEGRVAPLPSPLPAATFGSLAPDGGRAAWEAVLARSGALTEWLLERELVAGCPRGVPTASPEERVAVVRRLAPVIRACADAVLANVWLMAVAQRLGVAVRDVRRVVGPEKE